MKKKILFVAAIFAGSLAFGQGTTTSMKNKKGLEYLPQAGDWVLQFDATPLLDFGLNAIKLQTNTGATAQHLGYVGGFSNVIVGKMYTTATEAWRVKVGINYLTNTTETTAMYGANNDKEYVTTSQAKTTNVVLGFGKEWRRGHNRLQGFYGGEALLRIGSPTSTTSLEYSVDLKEAIDSGAHVGPRSLGVTKSSAFGFGVRGFVGVDYFVLPKISVGAEFGWGIGFQTSSGEVTVESLVGTDVEETVNKAPKNSGLSIGIDDGGSTMFGGSAAINVSFHF